MCVRALRGFCHVRLFVTPWTVAHQVPLSVGFSRQEHWSGCHALLQEIFLIQGLNPHYLGLLHSQASSLPWHHLGSHSGVVIHP